MTEPPDQPTPPTPPTSAELQDQARAETVRATEIAQRRSEIDQEIYDKRAEIKEARIAAARAGEAVETPTLSAELDALLAEREDLPEEHFAARESAASLGIQAEALRQQELLPQIQDATAEWELREEEAAEARRIADEANAQRLSLLQRRYISRQRQKDHEQLAEQIQRTGVWQMPPLVAG